MVDNLWAKKEKKGRWIKIASPETTSDQRHLQMLLCSINSPKSEDIQFTEKRGEKVQQPILQLKNMFLDCNAKIK